jgi:adenosylhomocysteinase
MTLAICLHIEPKTGVWIETLAAGGGRIVATGSPGTTRDATARALNLIPGVTVLGRRADNRAAHLRHCRDLLGHAPDLIADNGGDLHAVLAEDASMAQSLARVRGATEETTSGGARLREELRAFSFPTWVINDTEVKRVVENRFGVGLSVFDGLLRATNIMPNGKLALVIGYGFCGSGIARYLGAAGGRVMIADPSPMRRLEAHMEGFETGPIEKLLPRADLCITATGRDGVVNAQAFNAMKDGCILANAGHFETELDLPWLVRNTTVSRVTAQISAHRFADGRTVFLLAGGALVNLSAGSGNPIEVMDVGLALQSLSLERLACGRSKALPGVLAVPHEIEHLVAEMALERWASAPDIGT